MARGTSILRSRINRALANEALSPCNRVLRAATRRLPARCFSHADRRSSQGRCPRDYKARISNKVRNVHVRPAPGAANAPELVKVSRTVDSCPLNDDDVMQVAGRPADCQSARNTFPHSGRKVHVTRAAGPQGTRGVGVSATVRVNERVG